MFSPLTRKRFRAFWRRRRARWALMVFGLLFLFSLGAELVCPCAPNDVVDAAGLKPLHHAGERVLAAPRVARADILPDGTLVRVEGFSDYLQAGANISNCAWAAKLAPGFWRQPGAHSADGLDVCVRKGTSRLRVTVRDPADSLASRIARSEYVGEGSVSWPYPPCAGHPFGIDAAGRDVYARVVHALRISLLFGMLLVAWALLGGVVFGAVQGYFGGWVDVLGQRATEIWSAMPFLYVMIFVGAAIGRSFILLLLCYGLFNWIGVAAYVRAEFLRLREMAYVDAARSQGLSNARILFVHILPNALTPLITLFPFALIGAIASLAALDFLGFGLPPLAPSLGELLQQAQQCRDAWWLVLFPSLALFLAMFSAVLVGEGLREAFDPRVN